MRADIDEAQQHKSNAVKVKQREGAEFSPAKKKYHQRTGSIL